jgi:hypothetical protein
MSGAERTARYRARLSLLRPAEPGPVREITPGRNERALERSLRALREAGRIDDVDAAMIALARTLARSLDTATSAHVVASIGRVHLEALRRLTNVPGHADDDDGFNTLLEALRGTPG